MIESRLWGIDRTDTQNKGRKQKKTDPHKYAQLNFDKDTKEVQRRKDKTTFPTNAMKQLDTYRENTNLGLRTD
jgi:hypothetical protein